MKAVFFTADAQLEIRDIPIPEPKAGEYLIRIDACGICGSDVEGFLGKTGRRIPPMIMGHECAGTVAAAPEGGRFSVGTKVAVFPKFFCGTCAQCRSGMVNLCPNADFLGVMDYNGAMTEYICVREAYLVPFAGLPADIASLAEPAAVAYSGVSKLTDAQLRQAGHILVVGAGTIGLLVLLWLKHRGAKHVLVSDTSDARLSVAAKMGADVLINPLQCEHFEKHISEMTSGAMCDYAFEAVGLSASAQASVEALKASGLAVWIGNASKMASVNMQYVVTKQLTIKGSYIYSFADFARQVQVFTELEASLGQIISKRMPMEQGVEAFELLKHNRNGEIVKIILHNDL